jgi:sugar lactone lactonase YvrE
MRLSPIHALSATLLLAAAASGQSPHTLPDSLAAAGAPVLIPRTGGAGATVFAEGVAADWAGNVYYNEMDNSNKTMRLQAGADTAKFWRQAKDVPNGMWLDTQNRLVICQQKAIVRVKTGAAFDNLTDTLYKYPSAGENFNDVTGDSRDNLYFTNFNGMTVYFRDAATGQTREVLTGRPKPNGVEWDEERKLLYVNENGDNKVAVYDVGADYSPANRRDFADVQTSDGIVLDERHNVYAVSYDAKVNVFAPDKRLLGEIPMAGQRITNLAFGGADFKTLYMITDRGLYKLPMKVKGYKSGQPSSTALAAPFGARGKSPGLFGSGFPGTRFRADGRLIQVLPVGGTGDAGRPRAILPSE